MALYAEEPLPASEVAGIVKEVFGTQAHAARALRLTTATISRWCTGVTPVGRMEARVLRLLRELHHMGVDWEPLLKKYDINVAEVLSRDEVI